MLLADINKKWLSYKDYYKLDSGVEIESVCYDAADGCDSSFNIAQLYSDRYILHLNKDIDLYRSEYIDYILWHEFTHLYDFLTQPFSYKVLRKIYLYMNTYSEYHASRRALDHVMKDIPAAALDPDKSMIPAAYKDISLRNLINDTLQRAKLALHYFRNNPGQQAFHVCLRYIMYLMGYSSLFENAEDILAFCFLDLEMESKSYMELFEIMQNKDFFKILPKMDTIYEEAGLTFEHE